jgi:hypothetical protein
MLKRFIFWEYSRGSWQYDVIVGIILAFLFLTPRDWFRDQPRIPQASDITALRAADGGHQYLVNSEALANVAKDRQVETLTRLLRARSGNRHLIVTGIESVPDSEGELQVYIVYTRP